MAEFSVGSLALYKVRPARVVAVTDKIEIELEGGKNKRVRDKDVQLLHPGPCRALSELEVRHADIEESWELLDGEQVDLADLAELIFGEYTPATAWSAWQYVADGLYFEGSPECIVARPAERIVADREARERKQAAKQAWDDMIARLKSGRMAEEDRKALAEVERVALNTAGNSRIMEALGLGVSSEQAHALLIRVGYWPLEFNPHPPRFGLDMSEPGLAVPELPDEERRDLTHLTAWAIDDEGNTDPDDAISIDGDRLWVHVADVAALVTPDSELDREARARAANQYLPEITVHMLPEAITEQLGIGLREVSPALSIGFRIAEDGSLSDIEISASRVRASRISYQQADGRLEEDEFAAIKRLTDRYCERRKRQGAARIDLPEVSVRVVDGEVVVKPLPRIASRDMVTDAMLAAGEAAARFALENAIPVPFATQPPPASDALPENNLPAMYAFRRNFKPSRSQTQPEPHAGLGLEVYTRATSPLRRYLDLVTHQQLRAFLKGETPLNLEQLTERIGAAEAVSGLIRKAERLSNTHWKLIKLHRDPEWRADAVVVEVNDKRATLLVPSLALEARLRMQKPAAIGDELGVKCREADIPGLSARLQVV